MEVGIRELRADLSRWLTHVRAGEEVVVTDRGKPVARLVAISGERPLDRLIAAGVVKPARDRSGWRPAARVKASGTVSDLLAEQRR